MRRLTKARSRLLGKAVKMEENERKLKRLIDDIEEVIIDKKVEDILEAAALMADEFNSLDRFNDTGRRKRLKIERELTGLISACDILERESAINWDELGEKIASISAGDMTIYISTRA